MRALVVIVIALGLLVGAIVGALVFTGGPAAPAPGGGKAMGNAVLGKQVSMRLGCATCHSEDGSIMQGPSFKGLWGSVVQYDDGSSGLIDDTEVRAALRAPNEKVIQGFEPRMPEGLDKQMNEDDWMNLLAYLRSLGTTPPGTK